MSLGKNLQYLRQLSGNMTQEALAEKLMLVVRQSQNGKAMPSTKYIDMQRRTVMKPQKLSDGISQISQQSRSMCSICMDIRQPG